MKYCFKRRLLYILLRIIEKIILFLPYKISLAIGRLAGVSCYPFLRRYSNVAKHNLLLALGGEKAYSELTEIAQGVFKNLGMGACEILSLPKIKKNINRIIYSVGFEKIDAALNKGKGAIILSFHLGNWELLPTYFVSHGYPSNVIARRIYYDKYNEWVFNMRKASGVNVIYSDESPKKLFQALKRNELLGIMPDQDIDSLNGIFVNFFKRPTYTPKAPVALALKTGSPLIPCLIIREDSRHRIVIEDPIELVPSGDIEADIKKYTQQWSDLLEAYVRKYPDQWAWIHRRWKTRPEDINA